MNPVRTNWLEESGTSTEGAETLRVSVRTAVAAGLPVVVRVSEHLML
jgi:hypothetical protein